MQARIRILLLSVMLLAILFLSAGPVASQVGPEALENCRELAFSTEEDFVSGETIISDGDLLGITYDATGGPQCAICARNIDLLGDFDEQWDLGLDAADVIDVDGYVVAFSTELDSMYGNFTAGDLLVTTNGTIFANWIIIENQALTVRWQPGYDLGLDAVHFVGERDSILTFLKDAAALSPVSPEELAGLFDQHPVDIWFSTEGTLGPVLDPTFLDGDLLSARNGNIVAGNDVLLPLTVPAGLWDRGVDFGLDAVTTDRAGDRRNIHFSTEILFDGDPSFTDGDALRLGNGVAATNYDLVGCFNPKARELGLDALSAGISARECENRLTEIADVSVNDISLVEGTAMTGTLPIMASVPFGGQMTIEGTICDDVDQFRVVYRQVGLSVPWEPMEVPGASNWQVTGDDILHPGNCDGEVGWASGTDGWYNANDYRQLTRPLLGGCNPGLPLTIWESAAAIPDPDVLYEVALETMTASVVSTDTIRLVQLDNTPPTVELDKQPGVCDAFTSADMPLMVQGRMQDDHFYRYRLRITGDGYPLYPYPVVRFYDDPTDNVIATGTKNWNNFVDLHAVSVFDLAAEPVECGYTVLLRGWDRTLSSEFDYPSNLATRCLGCVHTDDAWTFNFTP